jgi:hypothetical protein
VKSFWWNIIYSSLVYLKEKMDKYQKMDQRASFNFKDTLNVTNWRRIKLDANACFSFKKCPSKVQFDFSMSMCNFK